MTPQASETGLTVFKRQELVEASTFEVMGAAFELAAKLATTEFVPIPLRNKPAAVAACILQGHEVGLPPMASLQHIHVIEGRPSLDAAAQRSLVLSAGHEIWIEEQTATRATVCGRRKGEDRVLEVTWTLDDAKRAQLSGKQNWQRYPRQMLVARATGDVCRGAFMDVLAGIPHNTEELEDGAVIQLLGEPVAAAAEEPKAPTTRRRAGRAATDAAETEPPPAPEPEPAAGDQVKDEGSEPPPAPDPEPVPEAEAEGQVARARAALGGPAEATAGDKAEGEKLSLAQRIAIACREAGIDRRALVKAVTGKEKASEVTQSQAIEILNVAHEIGRGELVLVDAGEGNYQVMQPEKLAVEPEADADRATGVLPDDEDGWGE